MNTDSSAKAATEISVLFAIDFGTAKLDAILNQMKLSQLFSLRPVQEDVLDANA